MANNGTIRGFIRRRYPILVETPKGFGWKPTSEGNRPHIANLVNKLARANAIQARNTAMRILGKVGLHWARLELTGLTGERLLAYMEAAKLTKPHGFVPGQDATYKHINPTKGWRFVPA